jgi:pyruvate formate lyase activating enzyme
MEPTLSRRDFLVQASCGAFGCALGLAAWEASALSVVGDTDPKNLPKPSDPRFYKRLDGAVQCLVCPRGCVLAPGDRSNCKARTNLNGQLATYAYANPAVIAVDPLGKYPLSQFLPDREALTLASGACNLHCKYCQNWKESQSEPETLQRFPLKPADAVRGARDKGLDCVGFTYTGAIAGLEYILDVLAAAKAEGLRTVVGTGLHVNPAPLRWLCEVTDAFAVTLKGYSRSFYREVIDGDLDVVLRNLEALKARGVWFELTYLVVPTLNDDLKKIENMCGSLCQSLGSDVPLHFSRFVPIWRLADLPQTQATTLEKCRAAGLAAGLRHVYIANLSPHEGNNTVCSRCKKVVVERLGFKVISNAVVDGRCRFCKSKLAGVWS